MSTSNRGSADTAARIPNLVAAPASASSLTSAAAGCSWVARQIPIGDGKVLEARIYGRRVDGLPTPLVLHFHGGAFTAGSLESGAPVAQLLAQAGAVVLSIDYPLAPAHPFPDGAEAGHAAAMWLYRNRRRLGGDGAVLLVAGEEAGGNLAAAVALMSRDRQRPPIAGQRLLSPMLDPCLGTASLRDADLDIRECPWSSGWASYLSRIDDACHPYAAPASCMRLAQLAPTLVVTARDDPMRDETLAFAAKLRAAGVPVEQAVVESATGWPQSHAEPESTQAAWAAQLRDELRRFIAARSASSSPKGDSRS